MGPEIREAIENARTSAMETPLGYYQPGNPPRRISFARLTALVRAVISELPDDMTLAELREELAAALETPND